MAKLASMRWHRFGGLEPYKPSRKKRKRGITNSQAKFLAALQRKAGEKYTGNGMSCAQASSEIDRLLGKPPKARPPTRLDREWEQRAARDE